ncbi:MAG: outer membrane protein OmpA-like peptidoglycan-associated protein [Polaribacter sp.]|jgi:outer membrane protein OmpA-like peptidoglycan-associated protein
MKQLLTKASLFILMLFTFVVNASFKQYEATLSESEWQFHGNPIGCKLTHQVPYYGQAKFRQLPGKNEALNFSLSYKKQPVNYVKVASVKSLSADWFPGQSARDIGETEILSGKHIFKVSDMASWRLLNELEVGRFPTFQYQDFESRQDQVSVSLSTVGFLQPYDQFLDCLTSLVPHKLPELVKMTLHFDFDQHKVRPKNLEKLKSLAAYAKYSDDLDIVFLNGYTDAKGSKSYNTKLSSRRIASVQKILSFYGAPKEKFKLSAFGEKFPVATNRKAWGRAKNRRVYVKVMLK